MAGKRRSKNRRIKDKHNADGDTTSPPKSEESTQENEEVHKSEGVNPIDDQSRGNPEDLKDRDDNSVSNDDPDATSDGIIGLSKPDKESQERNEDTDETKTEGDCQDERNDDKEKLQDIDEDPKVEREVEKGGGQEDKAKVEVDQAEEEREEKHDIDVVVDDEEGEQNEDSNDNNNEEDEDEEEEGWDLKHIHTIEEIKSGTMKCMTKRCPLIACTTYVSSIDSSSVWYSCLDCQEKDYGGWPTEIEEIPVKFLTEEHREVMSEMCTGRYSPEMPNIPTNDPSKVTSPQSHQATTKLTTLDKTDLDTTTQSNVNQVSAVTPPPGQRRQSLATTASSTATGTTTKKVTPIPSKPSNQALAMHKKWQESAKALGGERIVVSKPEAKKLILELLKDSFKPMNITDIFKVSL